MIFVSTDNAKFSLVPSPSLAQPLLTSIIYLSFLPSTPPTTMFGSAPRGTSPQPTTHIRSPPHIAVFFFVVFLFFCFLFFLGPQVLHMEVPRLGAESELQLPAYTTAIATWDPSLVCNLHDSSRQLWILNPLSKARGQTCILVDPSRVHHPWATMGTPSCSFWPLPSEGKHCVLSIPLICKDLVHTMVPLFLFHLGF